MRDLIKEKKRLAESMQRHCEFYKAKNKKWYMELASREHGEDDDATTYGPFHSDDNAIEFLHDNFSNPGGYGVDKRGTARVPKKSPNGRPVQDPLSFRGGW